MKRQQFIRFMFLFYNNLVYVVAQCSSEVRYSVLPNNGQRKVQTKPPTPWQLGVCTITGQHSDYQYIKPRGIHTQIFAICVMSALESTPNGYNADTMQILSKSIAFISYWKKATLSLNQNGYFCTNYIDYSSNYRCIIVQPNMIHATVLESITLNTHITGYFHLEQKWKLISICKLHYVVLQAALLANK